MLIPLVMSLLAPLGAQAQTLNGPGDLQIKGSLDLYYQTSPQAHRPLGGSTTLGPNEIEGRSFDRLHNQWVLNSAEISVLKKHNQVSFRADLMFGMMADVLAGNTQLVTAADATNEANEPTKNISQAFVSYQPERLENLTVTAGKFYTPVGFEVTRTHDNWQVSRSFLFSYGVPFWHQGVNVNYAWVPSKFSTTLYLLNAWDGRLSQERNTQSTLGLSANWAATDSLTLIYNYLGGSEAAQSRQRREVHEMNASWTASPLLIVAGDLVLGQEKEALAGADARWSAAALYVKWSPVENFYFSPRFEIFDGSDGYALSGFNGTPAASARQRVQGVTLTASWRLDESLETRLEARRDQTSGEGFFVDADGVTAINHQESYAASVLYQF